MSRRIERATWLWSRSFGREGSKISIAELVPSQGEIVAAEVIAMDSGAVVNVIPTDVTDPDAP